MQQQEQGRAAAATAAAGGPHVSRAGSLRAVHGVAVECPLCAQLQMGLRLQSPLPGTRLHAMLAVC